MLNFEDNTIDLDLFKRILREIKANNYDQKDKIIDSFSENQFRAKSKILEFLSDILTPQSRVAILGGWYGSILIPALVDKVERINIYDMDETAIQISKNIISNRHEKVQHYIRNVFDDIPNEKAESPMHPNSRPFHEPAVRKYDIIINPSCEHMPPMKDWPWWESNKYFCLTSNNMYGIEGHINCVETIDDFIMQLPPCDILDEDIISDERGDRFLVFGKTL